jgi:hypothetical protein
MQIILHKKLRIGYLVLNLLIFWCYKINGQNNNNIALSEYGYNYSILNSNLLYYRGFKLGLNIINVLSCTTNDTQKITEGISKLITSIHRDHQNNLWICSANGVLKINEKGERTIYKKGNGLNKPNVTFIFEDSKDRMWFSNFIGTRNFIGCIENNEWKYEISLGPVWLTSDAPDLIYEDREGRIYFGTDKGLFIFEDGVWHTVNKSNGLTSDRIRFLYVSMKDELIVFTDEDIISVKGNDYNVIIQNLKKNIGNITQFQLNSNKDVFLLNDENKIFLYHDNKIQNIDLSNVSGLTGIKFLFVDSQDNLILINSSIGIAVNNGQKWETILFSDLDSTLAKYTSFDLLPFKDPTGNVWLFRNSRSYYGYKANIEFLLKYENGKLNLFYAVPICWIYDKNINLSKEFIAQRLNNVPPILENDLANSMSESMRISLIKLMSIGFVDGSPIIIYDDWQPYIVTKIEN